MVPNHALSMHNPWSIHKYQSVTVLNEIITQLSHVSSWRIKKGKYDRVEPSGCFLKRVMVYSRKNTTFGTYKPPGVVSYSIDNTTS
jgi:hypothetical protein